MGKGLLVSFFFFFTSSILFGQDNYREGKIIHKDNREEVVLIEYLDWEKTPKYLSTKRPDEESITTFDPNQIAGFEINGEKYFSALVKYEASTDQLQKLTETEEMSYFEERVFLKVMFEGLKSLYSYTHSSGTDFYITENEEIIILKQKKYFRKNRPQGRGTITEVKIYLNQLNSYLGDCPGIFQKLQSVTYEEQSLKDLFRYYIKSMRLNSEIKELVPTNRYAFMISKTRPKNLGVFAGFHVGFFDPASAWPKEFSEQVTTAEGFLFGAKMDVPIRFKKDIWKLQFKLKYGVLSNETAQEVIREIPQFIEKHNYKLEYIHSSLSTEAIRMFGQGKIKPYAGLGLEINFLNGGGATRIREITRFNSIFIVNDEYPLFDRVEVAPVISIGAEGESVFAGVGVSAFIAKPVRAGVFSLIAGLKF